MGIGHAHPVPVAYVTFWWNPVPVGPGLVWLWCCGVGPEDGGAVPFDFPVNIGPTDGLLQWQFIVVLVETGMTIVDMSVLMVWFLWGLHPWCPVELEGMV